MARYRLAEVEGMPPFPGGAVGLFAYDLVRTVEPLGPPNPDPLGLPDLALMVAGVMVVFDHHRQRLSIIANAFTDDDGGLEAAHAAAVERIELVTEALAGPLPDDPEPRSPG